MRRSSIARAPLRLNLDGARGLRAVRIPVRIILFGALSSVAECWAHRPRMLFLPAVLLLSIKERFLG
nr:MAG TPA: hypothetical protein [Caudoviricetes sp.]